MLVMFICYLAAAYVGGLGYLLLRAPLPPWPKRPLVGLFLSLALWLGYAGYATHTLLVSPGASVLSTFGVLALFGVGASALWVSDCQISGERLWPRLRWLSLAIGLVLVLAVVRSALPTGPLTVLSLFHGTLLQWGWGVWVVGSWSLGVVHLAGAAIRGSGYVRLYAHTTMLVLILLLLLASLVPVHPGLHAMSSLLVVLVMLASITILTGAVMVIAHHPTPQPRRILGTGLVFFVTTGALIGFIAVALPYFSHYCILYFRVSPYYAVVMSTVGMVVCYPLVMKVSASLVRRILFAPSGRSQVSLPEIAHLLNTIHDRVALATVVSETFDRLFVSRDLAIYLCERELLHRTTPDRPATTFPAVLPLADPRGRVPQTQVVLPTPVAAQGDAASGDGTALVVPFTLGERLLGLALLGPKCTGGVYTDEDVAVCEVIRQQVAVALAHLEAHDRLCEVIATLDARVAYQTRELTEVNARLREADQAKDQFLALVSHELLSPLTSILGWSDLPPTKRTLDTMTEALDAIQRSGLRQKRLVDDLLDVSRIIHGKLVVTCAPAELWTLVRHAVDECQTQVTAKSITLVLTPPPAPLPVVVDPIRITQVISNLVQNAVKFTPDGGTVTLTGRQEAAMAVVEVADTGRGIAPEVLPHLFTAFTQAPQSPYAGGLGLGLAIVKGIIDLHGGQVTAESAGEGCGSRFVISLPLAVTPELDAETAGRVPACAQQPMPEVMIEDETRQFHARYGANSPSTLSLREALTHLPVETIDAMRTALQQGDILQLKALIEQVGADQPQLVQVLRMFADRYDYDKLHSLLAADDCPDGLTRAGDHHGDR